MGDDHPRPGTSIDHATLSVADQRSGSFEPSAMPLEPGPRNWRQSGPAAPPERDMRLAQRTIAGRLERMPVILTGGGRFVCQGFSSLTGRTSMLPSRAGGI